MYNVTLDYAKNNFEALIARAKNEPGGVAIVQDNQSFVFISQEELESWVETAELLQDGLLADVQKAREDYQRGEVATMEEVFD